MVFHLQSKQNDQKMTFTNDIQMQLEKLNVEDFMTIQAIIEFYLNFVKSLLRCLPEVIF